jgi:hypothetical protein
MHLRQELRLRLSGKQKVAQAVIPTRTPLTVELSGGGINRGDRRSGTVRSGSCART